MILEHCKVQLAEYKKPRRISLVPALPLTANGKPDKKRLLSMIEASAERGAPQ
jgi:non-ribosomal peptide synthetase component E (peptide arylation enzyme)